MRRLLLSALFGIVIGIALAFLACFILGMYPFERG